MLMERGIILPKKTVEEVEYAGKKRERGTSKE